MKQFISKKRVKIPRYKLYYFVFAISIFLIFFMNLIFNLVFRYMDQEKFLNVLLGNGFGNVMEYQLSNFGEDYFYQNTFGIPTYTDETVMREYGSMGEVISSELKEVVYLYNTFQTHKYKSNYFNKYSVSSFVTQASFILSEYLAKYGVGSVVEEESVAKIRKEEDIAYTYSYRASRILLERKKEDIPSLNYYFDLQLSSEERSSTTVEIDGLSYAKILFVVGTEYGSFKENQNFAVNLDEKLKVLQPKLSRGVSLRGGDGYHGVYNQDFSPNTLLVQIGGVDNTIDEVNRSLKILGEVIAQYILEDINEEE